MTTGLSDDFKKVYVYRNKDGKLILPDFVYDFYSQFSLSGRNGAGDFAIYVMTNTAGRAETFSDGENSSDNNLEYYTSLYLLINKEGGLDNCELKSDYLDTDNHISNEYDELINAGIVTKEELLLNNEEEITVVQEDSSEDNNNLNKVKTRNILRNENGYIIIPDNIYESYQTFDGDDAYKFASYITKIDYSKINNPKYDILDYYAAIFKLLEKEGSCIKLSEYCKKEKCDIDFFNLMIDSGKINNYIINLEKNGIVKEKKVKSNFEIKDSIYYINQAKKENKAFYKNLDTELDQVLIELKNVDDYIKITNNDDYATYKSKTKCLYSKLNEIYVKYKTIAKNDDNNKKSLLEYLESKYNDSKAKIEATVVKIEQEYKKIIVKDEKEKIDYYEHIKSSIDSIDKELDNISSKMTINSEKDFIKFHSKLSGIRDKLYELFDSSMESALEDGALTGSLVQEASTKHNNAIEKVNKLLENLEEQKRKTLFKNIFNT